MIISNDFSNMRSKLNKLQKTQTELDKKINKTPKANNGALNMDFFRVKKDRDVVRSQAARLRSMLGNDTIA